MSTNKYRNSVIIYTEDEATFQFAEEWINVNNGSIFNRAKVLIKKGRGWRSVTETALHDNSLKNYPHRRIVILIDLDKAKARIEEIKNKLPPECADKFHIVGWQGNIETLKQQAECPGKGFRKLVEKLFADYQNSCDGFWQTDFFSQMRDCNECERLRDEVIPLILRNY